MQHTNPAACLDFGILRYVRDHQPTEAMLLAWLGAHDAGKLYTLKKAGLLECTSGQVRLSPQHLSLDGKSFRFEDKVFRIDEGVVQVIRRK